MGIPFFGLEKSLFFVTGANLVIGISAWFLLDEKYRVFKYVAALVAVLVYLGIPYFSQTQVPADFIGEGARSRGVPRGLWREYGGCAAGRMIWSWRLIVVAGRK